MASVINASSSGAGGLVSSGDSSGVLQLQNNGSTSVTLDTSGNVGIGTSSPTSKLNVSSTTANDAVIRLNNTNAGVYASTLNIDAANATGSRYNSLYSSNSGTFQWSIGGGGSDSTMVFGTGSSNTERMRIDSSGNLLIGYISSNGSYKLQVNSQIFATSSTIATSDARYKENVEELSGALDIVKSLRPVSFDWKVHPIHNFDTKTKTVGFLAQDVQQALAGKPYLNSIIKTNECVIEPEVKDENGTVTKEAVTEEFLGIAEGNMISILTAAIKELKAEFDAYVIAHP